ncbi:unnamed protein product [Caenorhabditis angaria]|uniref:Uncharacterized protein n=1 Tax=Caenorhabditis angaria TaxID=860376 RepID=A0A9P1ISK1_9PELO|nr:unnamed protein product [Caenorhabditis angaria]
MGTRKNCYREEKFKKILDKKPKYRNTRPNILINENTTILDMENVEKCCYERHCLHDCGFGSNYIEDSYFGRKMPDNLPQLIQKYYSFFKVFNKTEIDQLMDDSADDIVIEHWEIKLLELSDNRGKIERKQRFAEERKKRDEDV